MRPILVLRVGYMERYDGPDIITSGGSYVHERGVGGEVFNFKPSRGKCYGYAMSRHFSGINLQFIDDSRPWREGDELSGVDVVFIARHPQNGQVVVGWYRGATVFHKQYRVRRGAIPGMDELTRQYLCVADASNATLLANEERTFQVPYAPAGHKGFPGQSNVWYPENNLEQPEVARFVDRLRAYMTSDVDRPMPPDEISGPNTRCGGGRTRNPDHAHNAAVEAAAVKAAWNYYEADGYIVVSVESEKLGWDLFVTKKNQKLHVEVKGVSGATIFFELTPNEYAKLKELGAQYRVCVVCDALIAPRLYDLSPEKLTNGWRLISKKHSVLVPLLERTAAVGVEVAHDGAKS